MDEWMRAWLVLSWLFSFLTVGATFDKSKPLGYEAMVCTLAMLMKWFFVGWVPWLIWRFS